MAAETIAAWIAAGAALGSAGVAWFAQRNAARVAAAVDRTVARIEGKTDVYNNDRSIYVEHVTAERGKWRSDLRRETAIVVARLSASAGAEDCDQRAFHAAISGIALRLNPKGRSERSMTRDEYPLDRDIFATIADIRSSYENDAAYAALAGRLERAVALLLKQEWQVSKDEARRTDLR